MCILEKYRRGMMRNCLLMNNIYDATFNILKEHEYPNYTKKKFQTTHNSVAAPFSEQIFYIRKWLIRYISFWSYHIQYATLIGINPLIEPGKLSLKQILHELVSVTISWKPVNNTTTYIRFILKCSTDDKRFEHETI